MTNKELQDYLKQFPDDFQPIVSVCGGDQWIIWEPINPDDHILTLGNKIFIGND